MMKLLLCTAVLGSIFLLGEGRYVWVGGSLTGRAIDPSRPTSQIGSKKWDPSDKSSYGGNRLDKSIVGRTSSGENSYSKYRLPTLTSDWNGVSNKKGVTKLGSPGSIFGGSVGTAGTGYLTINNNKRVFSKNSGKPTPNWWRSSGSAGSWRSTVGRPSASTKELFRPRPLTGSSKFGKSGMTRDKVGKKPVTSKLPGTCMPAASNNWCEDWEPSPKRAGKRPTSKLSDTCIPEASNNWCEDWEPVTAAGARTNADLSLNGRRLDPTRPRLRSGHKWGQGFGLGGRKMGRQDPSFLDYSRLRPGNTGRSW